MRFRPIYLFLALALLSCLTGWVGAQTAEFYPLNLVQPGQKGIGKTVFSGGLVESFDVEILGVLENVGPGQNMILARLSGPRLEQTGVFAGMSGSPVYLEGRLVGAIAYAFSFATEPIAGITPIGEMVDIFKENVPVIHRVAWQKPSQILRTIQTGDLQALLKFPTPPEFAVDSSLAPSQGMGSLRPIATPVGMSGFSPQTLIAFGPQFQALGLTPVRGAGSGRLDTSKDIPFEPGSTVTVQLVRGDMDVSAAGTVTHISGDKVYAFGHPFLSVGYTDLPMNKAAVLAVIPSLMNSQKISASGELIGSIRQDRATGIMGVRGAAPRMIPVKLTLHTSRNETKLYQYEVVTDNFLTPFLLTYTIHNSIVSSERAIGGQTLQVKCTVSLKDQPDINFESSVSDLVSSPVVAALSAASPVSFILNSGFENVIVEKVDLEITAVEQTREAILDKVWLDRLEVKPGEELELTVFLRKSNGEILSEKYPVQIPAGIGPGPLQIVIADGMTMTLADTEMDKTEFVPQNLGQLVKAINNLKKNDRLYIRLFRSQPGAVIGGEGLPALPPSLLALFNSGKTAGDSQSIDQVIYQEHELPSTPFVLKGRKTAKIEIIG